MLQEIIGILIQMHNEMTVEANVGITLDFLTSYTLMSYSDAIRF